MNRDTNNDAFAASVEKRLTHLQAEIDKLKQRNFEKDRGKEFESSYTRIFFLMVVTYWTLFGYMAIIKTNQPFLDAIVPTVGFNISTWSLPHVKEIWIQARHYYRHGESESTSRRRLMESNVSRNQGTSDTEEGALEDYGSNGQP